MKTFVGHNVIVPRDWALHAGAPSHVQQIQVLVRAASKADVAALYTEVEGRGGEHFAKEVRLAGTTHYRLGNRWEAVVDTGAVEERGIYVCYRHIVGDRVVRMEPDGTGVPVGQFVRPDGSAHHGMEFRPAR